MGWQNLNGVVDDEYSEWNELKRRLCLPGFDPKRSVNGGDEYDWLFPPFKFILTEIWFLLLMFDLDFDKIQLAERFWIFFKISSDFIQDTEPILSFRTKESIARPPRRYRTEDPLFRRRYAVGFSLVGGISFPFWEYWGIFMSRCLEWESRRTYTFPPLCYCSIPGNGCDESVFFRSWDRM